MDVLPSSISKSTLRGVLPTFGEWVGVVLVGLPLFVTFFTIEKVEWIDGLPSLSVQLVISLAVGMLLVHQRLSWKILHPIGLVVGVVVGALLGLWRLADSPVLGAGIFLSIATWWTAYFTLWLAYRRASPMLMLLPSAVVLLVALSFLPISYYPRAALYLLAAAPALAHFHGRLRARAGNWWPRVGPLAAGSVLMAAAVSVAWLAPWPEHPVRPAGTAKLEDSWYDLLNRTSFLFERVPNKRQVVHFNLHPYLPFTNSIDPAFIGSINPGDEVIMLTRAAEPHKWRVAVYETYTPQGWTRSPDSPRLGPVESALQRNDADAPNRAEVELRVRSLSLTGLMASVGEPVSASLPVMVETSPTPRFALNLEGKQATYVPPDVGIDRRKAIVYRTFGFDDSYYETLQRSGLNVIDVQELESIVTVEREQEGPPPAMSIQFPRRLSPPRSYATVGSISTATPEMLREAGGEYPTWVTDRYLQLPLDFPESVRSVARELAEGKGNTYDIAQSMVEYLGTLPYSLDILPPPQDRDGVEWFLNVQRVGYCQYYSSAMITMLRSLGIPARLVVGFTPGEWDSERKVWVVRAKHYHAWPEVYFPGSGWIEFEATPPGVQPNLEELGYERAPGDEPGVFLEDDECLEELEIEVCGLQPAEREDVPTDLLEIVGPEAGSGGLSAIAYWMTAVGSGTVFLTLGSIYYVRRQRNRLGYAARVYASFGFLARFGGARRQPQDTPEEFGDRLAALLPQRSGDIDEVVGAYEITRYSSDKSLGLHQVTRLRAAWRALKWALVGLIVRRLWPRLPMRKRRPRPVIGS